MRVVAGTARGRRLEAPSGRETRPTGDRVREATFNALHSLGAVEDADVLDLFAGSGAMGIEALSRGAASATFVDHDRTAVAVVEANLRTCGFTAGVHRSDARSFLSRGTAATLVVLDPPYATADETWHELLALLPDGCVAVLESDREIDPGAGWSSLRQRRYGSTVVTLARKGTE